MHHVARGSLTYTQSSLSRGAHDCFTNSRFLRGVELAGEMSVK